MSLYDVNGQGFLREQDVENYIAELIETLPQLDGLDKSFHSFYVCTAVRKFFFFLDPMRTGKIRIQDILACSFLDDLLELRDQDLPKDAQDANWFSAPSGILPYFNQYSVLKSVIHFLVYSVFHVENYIFSSSCIWAIFESRQRS